MPYKSEKIKLPKHLDRRIKFTEEKKEICLKLYNQDKMPIRQIAKILELSPRSIQFFLFPERLQENRKRRNERGGYKIYYDREKNNKTMKEHRRYKQKLYKENKISL